jgi:hypothetical protein
MFKSHCWPSSLTVANSYTFSASFCLAEFALPEKKLLVDISHGTRRGGRGGVVGGGRGEGGWYWGEEGGEWGEGGEEEEGGKLGYIQ